MNQLNPCLLVLALSLNDLSACASAPAPEADATYTEPTAAEPQPVVTNALTPDQVKTALKLIDDICGDTWCSGDYDFRFHRLTCTTPSATCTLGLQIIPREGVPATQPSYLRTCPTQGFTGFNSLVVTASNGYQSLDQDYYSELTECIATLEEGIR
jgi:hypothetical protein